MSIWVGRYSIVGGEGREHGPWLVDRLRTRDDERMRILVLAEPVDEPADDPVDKANLTATVEIPTLGGSPIVLGEPAEPTRGFSGLLHIEAEALSDGGSYFAREAVIALNRREALPYRLRLWRRGARVLFPALEDTR